MEKKFIREDFLSELDLSDLGKRKFITYKTCFLTGINSLFNTVVFGYSIFLEEEDVDRSFYAKIILEQFFEAMQDSCDTIKILF